MIFKRSGLFILIALMLVSCSETYKTHYKDTSSLERPPVLVIAEKPTGGQRQDLEEQDENKGLGSVVSLAGSTAQPILKIKKIFGRSWDIVEQALKLKEIEITDKNRDRGVFYLDFDPDKNTSKDSGMLSGLSFFLFEDEYESLEYKLTVQWRESDTEVSVEMVETADQGLLDDVDDEDEETIDSGARLIRVLYQTIRDDLPID